MSLAVAVALAEAGLAAIGLAAGRSDHYELAATLHAPLSASPPAPPSTTTLHAARLPRPLRRSTPTRLDIPRIGVHTRLVAVGLNRDGTIMIPATTGGRGPAGWYKPLATPGEVGSAVIVGHVDSARDGPAVFFRLEALRPGDSIAVQRADATTAIFAVTDVAEFPKTDFPTKSVYGHRDYPALTLVTCGGTFDRTVGSYRSNVVVYATLVATNTARAGTDVHKHPA